MIMIDVSEDARAAGRLAGEELRDAVDALRDDGFVVLNDVVDPAHLDILHERMIGDLDALQARPDAPYNWNAATCGKIRRRFRRISSATPCSIPSPSRSPQRC